MIRDMQIWGALLVLAGAAFAATPEATPHAEPGGLDVWEDPTFQREFLGSYGFDAELEPRVSAVERESMEGVLRLIQAGSEDEAISELEMILGARRKRDEAEPSAIFDFTLGNLYFQFREDLGRAASNYERAIGKFPSFRRAHKNLGLIRVRRGEFEQAIHSLSKVIELGGRDALTFGLLGYAYASTDRHVAAESAYRDAMLLQPDLPDWKLGLTRSVFKQQKYGETVTLCDELIARYPERADTWLLQANAYIGMGQPMKAAQNFEIVQRMGKATLPTLYTLGDIYVNESMWDLALRAYALAAAQSPDQPFEQPAHRIEILAQRGALDEAQALLEQVRRDFGARLDEDGRKRLLKLEARMAVARGADGASAQVLEEIVSLDPLDGEALLLLGRHYARIGDPERAIFYYERAQSIDGFQADANVRHAQLLVGLSRYDEAIPLLERAQALKPRDDVARYLEQVERVARSRR